MQEIWRRHTASFDHDTIRFLTIVQHFLVEYFAHSEATAEQALDGAMAALAWDEDDYHDEGAYRCAAVIHHLHTFGGSSGDAFRWLRETGHDRAPEAARRYFWSHYLDAPPTGDGDAS